MKTLYLDCGMGAAGDMLTAALLELLPDSDAFVERLNQLSLPGVVFEKRLAVKCGITGTQISVTVYGAEEESGVDEEGHHCGEGHSHEQAHDHREEHVHEYVHHHGEDHSHEQRHDHEDHHTHLHRGMREIEQIVSDMAIPLSVQEDVLAVYRLVAEAEGKVHGRPVTEVHFHEVGAMDAIADITAVCLLMHELAPEEVVVSPIHVGCGQVKCAHGILPVPAPATACILENIPMYGGEIRGELCTPTGAALLKYFADHFGNMPVMRMHNIGYGMGKKDFEAANCVRAVFGETEGRDVSTGGTDKRNATQGSTEERTELVLELSCNLDDMTAEEIGFASERFFENGALDVYTVPIGMKKSRPGIMLNVLCRESDRATMVENFFRYTTTIGVREAVMNRYVLARKEELVQTIYGELRRKLSDGYGVRRIKYEYDDLSRIAGEREITLREVRKGLGNLE